MRATQLIALLLAVGGVAGAQDATNTWDFQGDKVDEAPAGFSFGKTGQGRPGKWVVRVDPSAPAGDHVLAQVDTPVAEVFVEAERDVPTAVSGLVGAIWRVRDGLSLDAGLRLARAGGVNTTEIRAGLTWAFSVGVPR
jgi:hypothetical protein